MTKHLNSSIPWAWNIQGLSQPHHTNDYSGLNASLLNFSQLLTLGISSYAPAMCLLGLLAIFKTYFSKIKSLLEDHFTSTLHVKATDETYDMVLSWVSSRGLDNLAKSIIARVGTKWKVRDGLSGNGKKPICISPWNGGFWFRFRGIFLSYQTQTVSYGLHKEEVITITCLGRSVQVLKDLIEECRVEYLKQGQNKTTVFKNCGDYWKKTTIQNKRPLSTVITSKTQKQDLIEDVKEFLYPQTQAWYAKRGIPYRRGFLLYGPPGTGKTSLVSAVAGEFDLDIRIISIPSVDDKKLEELFDSLPERCVVLLEDIDAVETNRSQNSDPSQKTKGMISLSGLLNTIDGVASQEGRILFMTTNHIDKLDGALKRPGRIDKELEIKLADKDVIIDLFKFIFKEDACRSTRANIEETGTKGDDGRVTQEKVMDAQPILTKHLFKLTTWWQGTCSIQENVLNEQEKRSEDLVQGKQEIPNMPSDHVNELADGFAAKVPEFTFSTAQIMSHLLQYKYSPEDAVKHAESWVGKLRTTDLRPPTENSVPSEDVLWMKGSNKESSGTDRLKKIKTFSNLRLTVPVSPPPSPCHSRSQPCSASTHFSLSTVGEAADCATSAPACIHIDNQPDSSTCATRPGFCNWKQDDSLESDMEGRKSPSSDGLPRAKAKQQHAHNVVNTSKKHEDIGSGDIMHSFNPSNFPVGWGTWDIGGVDIDSLLGDIGEDKTNEPEDVLTKNLLFVAKSGLLSHTEDDGATKMSEDGQRRLHKYWAEGKSTSIGMTMDSVSGSDERDRVQETEPEGGSDVRHPTGMASKTITVTTSIEQVVTRNTGAAEHCKLVTEAKAILPSSPDNTNAVSCLTHTSMTPDINGPISTPNKTQIGVAQLRPLPMNVDSLRTLELPEAFSLFSSDRDGLSACNTKPTVCEPGSCKVGQPFDHQIGHSLNDLFDQTEDYGGMDTNHGLSLMSECISEHNAEEAPANNKTQPEIRGSISTPIKVSSFSTPPLSAVGAPIPTICTPSSAKTDVQVELAVGAEKLHDDSEAEDVAEICGIDVDFDLNCGARRITEEDFVRLGLHRLSWAKMSGTITDLSPTSTAELRGLENAPKDSPFLVRDAIDGHGSEDDVSENKTRIDIGDSVLPANVHSLRNMRDPPSLNSFFGVCDPQGSPGDALSDSSPKRQAPKADDEPQTVNSAKIHDVIGSDSADESVWVKVEVDTDNLATDTDM